MAKEEEDLFGGIDLNKTFDTSEFEKDPKEGGEKVNEEDINTPKLTKEEVEAGIIDSTFFETEKKETEDKKDSVDDKSSADSSSSPMQLFASTLHAEGVIDLEEGQTIETEKELIAAWRKSVASNELADLNEDQRTYVEAIRNGIPEEEIKQNFNNIKALNGVTAESLKNNEELRKTLIAQDFIAKGIDAAKANELATRSIELGTDSEDATEALQSLKLIEGSRITKENARLAKEKEENSAKELDRISKLKTTILEKEEFIPNLKINSTTKDKIFKNMTEVVDYDDKGNGINAITKARLKDPENFEMMESMLYTITKGFTDFSKLTNNAKTTSVSELEKSLKTNQTGGGAPREIKSSTGKGLSEAINSFT